MRAIWTGSLSFGLVNIPVRMYSATADSQLHFHFLHRKDLSPVRYAKFCAAEDKELKQSEIVKGHEYKDGQYVTMEDADFEKANKRTTKTIDLINFVDEADIPPIFYDKPYYLEPDKNAKKPYALLHQALCKTDRVGLAKFVLRNREHLAAVKPVGGVIVLNQMRFNHEIRKPTGLDLPDSGKAPKKEVEMALKLVDQLTEDFKPTQYQDSYTKDLERVIEAKIKGKKPTAVGTAPKPTEVSSLMEALRASLDKPKKTSGKKKVSKKKAKA